MEEIPNQNIDMSDNNNNYGSKSNEIENNNNNNDQNNNKLKGFFNKIKNVNKLLKNNSTEENKEVDISSSNDIKNPENNPPTCYYL